MAMIAVEELNQINAVPEVATNECALNKLGGAKGLEKGLRTSFDKGLSNDINDLQKRRQMYGENHFPDPESDTWFGMFFESFEDPTLIVLIVAAGVSLAIGIMDDPKHGWIEGSAILFAVVLVAVVTATNNYNKEQQFRKLNAAKDDVCISCLREGSTVLVNVKDLVVGDIVNLNTGDKVPADGIMISGSDVECNESALTGESDDKKKSTKPASENGDVFLISGSTLSKGFAKMLVTNVGLNSRWGKTRSKLTEKSPDTPLQEKLTVLADQIGNLGMGTAVATFIAMLAIWYFYPNTRAEDVSFFRYVLKAFIMGVTIVVVAVPEGLPLAVTLSLAYSTQKMMADNNLIRVLAACETMGNATNICSDKTGTLTQNRMTVVEGWFAGKFYSKSVPLGASLPPEVLRFIVEQASINSTATLLGNSDEVVGNKTEGALLLMLKNQFKFDYLKERQKFDSSRGDTLFTFSSERKRMSVLLRNGAKGCGTLYTKGASEVVLSKCAFYMNELGEQKALDAATRTKIAGVIDTMARDARRTVALAHKMCKGLRATETADNLENDLVLDAIVGIMDPLRPDVINAVKECQAAGIFVRMVTGDNIETAKAIAKECGILTEGGMAMEGPDFRKLTPKQLDEILPKLQVLARSSPDDKHTLVTRLNGHALPKDEASWLIAHPTGNWAKDRDLISPGYEDEWIRSRGGKGLGEVVGVTGDGTNDGPALKAADVGLSMGLSGTDVAKEASDIVILDDNFSSIVKAVMWGRSVFDNIRKFLQFQLTVNVVALTLTFISALTGKDPPLNAVMMLWVNLIMDTMGALALGTEPPSPLLLHRRPYRRNASLVSNTMIRNILVQFLFQLALLTYLLHSPADFNVRGHPDSPGFVKEHFSIIFNTFVFAQVFNELNARSIGNEMNVLKGLSKNPIFVAIIAFTVTAQYILVQYGGDFVKTSPLSPDQWYKCILLGALSLPLGGLMRLIPVRDAESDFAPVSPLIQAAHQSRNSQSNTAVKDNNGFSLSFLVWFAVVTAIPVIAYQEFESAWMPHIQFVAGKFMA